MVVPNTNQPRSFQKYMDLTPEDREIVYEDEITDKINSANKEDTEYKIANEELVDNTIKKHHAWGPETFYHRKGSKGLEATGLPPIFPTLGKQERKGSLSGAKISRSVVLLIKDVETCGRISTYLDQGTSGCDYSSVRKIFLGARKESKPKRLGADFHTIQAGFELAQNCPNLEEVVIYIGLDLVTTMWPGFAMPAATDIFRFLGFDKLLECKSLKVLGLYFPTFTYPAIVPFPTSWGMKLAQCHYVHEQPWLEELFKKRGLAISVRTCSERHETALTWESKVSTHVL